MKINKYLKKSAIFTAFLLYFSVFSFAQTVNFPAPRQEKLLNGLKLLVWNDPQAPKVSVKIRIHSGSAFDPQNKEGVMALLGDILFPNAAVKEFFVEDLGGSLEVTSNFDYIQINATGDHDQILTILETLATAVTKPQIDKDTTAKVKTAKVEKVKELENNPSYIADRAVAKRLFGNFPYGRPELGTSETLAKIDFADILLAKQKFLTADNATIAISGNVKTDLMFRAARRYFGGWEKADKKFPATFTQPEIPDEKPLVIIAPSINNEEIRVAMNGFARNDKNFFASQILTKIRTIQFPDNPIQNKSYLLRGMLISVGNPIRLLGSAATDSDEDKQKYLIKQDEFEKAKANILAEMNQKNLTDFWLDVETYKLISVKDQIQKANDVKIEDVQIVLDRLKKQPAVIVSVIKMPETESKNK
jgi:predicted Zn-dependent peptidase